MFTIPCVELSLSITFLFHTFCQLTILNLNCWQMESKLEISCLVAYVLRVEIKTR
jgi:hypothetical protein